ncbi:glycosyltransferase [Alsobacter sp. SYSU M60028]|uniref:Glycosyltransferase n=1 Tax=Alsobacter ponti TaxID=2962936 RepID=A0ABT1LF82_9HYPH|nr:glycosyltransferase [Alsobacter ponti]MCP8939776.1 glycosyltransferase [Alsobacter ponti]
MNGLSPQGADREVRVAVCMTTFRRPEGAARALRALAGQVFPRSGGAAISAIVVDNDASGSAGPAVEAERAGFPWPLRYAVETRRGVASARNRCLDLVPEEADYVAFLDDDERPVPEWLDELVATARALDAEIVQGPVLSELEAGTPDWFAQGRFLELGPFPEGQTLQWGYSGNVLIATVVLRRLGLRFDGRFDRSGGEDQHFFIRALRAGVAIHTAPRAIAWESVPASRTNLAYLLRRRFRVGATLALVSRIERDGPAALALRAGKGVARTGLGLAHAAIAWPFGRRRLAEALSGAAFGAGMLAGLVGYDSREYDTIHGATAPAVAPPPEAS